MAVGFQAGAPKEFNATGRKDILGAARCSRCDGLMVPHWCVDLLVRRCVQCGDLVDPVILHNRHLRHLRWRGFVGNERGSRSPAWSTIVAEMTESEEVPADGNARKSSLA